MIAVRDSGDHEALVRRHIASFASLAALRALRLNNACTVEEIAAEVGCATADVRSALDAFDDAGLLEWTDGPSKSRCTLTTQGTLRAAVGRLIDRSEADRHFRTRLVLDILRRMSAAPSWG